MIGQAKDRFSSEEARAIDRLQLDMYNDVRQVNLKTDHVAFSKQTETCA